MKQQKKNKAMKWYRRLGILTWLVFCYVLLFAYIPDEIYMSKESDRIGFARGLPIVVDEVESTRPVFGAQRVGAAAENEGVLVCRLFDLIPVKQVVVHDADRQMVTAAGTNIVDIPIIMKDTTTRSIPVNCKFDSTSVREATINIPIFVSLKKE